MDWIRRNWPDLLIAIALVAVIAGIIATLLSGGSLWPSSRSGNQSLAAGTGRSVASGNNGTAPINLRAGNTAGNTNAGNGSALSLGNAPSGNLNRGNLNSGNVEVVSPSLNTGLGNTATNGQRSLGNGGASLAAPLTNRNNPASLAAPLNSPRTGTSSISADINNGNNLALGNNARAGAAGGVLSANGMTIPNNSNTASNAQQLAGRTTFASPQGISVNPASGASASAGGSYKISVGAFGVAANAQNLANRLSQQGYPVGFDQQGRLNVVYVGPFASQADADAVARQLRQAGQDTSVYADRQTSSQTSSQASTSQQQNVRQQNFAQQSTASSQNIAPAGFGQSYLQVGAYRDVPSSLSQRSRLESLGLAVYDRREGGYVKLIVGPFASNEVGIYRSQLRDRGIDSFPVN